MSARAGDLTGQHVLVGVSGSIAAYRACDIVRRLRELKASVKVAPTKSAAAFVTPLTFEALSGQPCLGGVLDVENGKIPHIEEAYRAKCAVVAPASADIIAKMAHGIADEALLATLLSYRGPLLIAPAMETRMWEHPATQDNVATLEKRGAVFVGPIEGPLASGRDGKGRLALVEDIVEAIVHALAPKDLNGVHVVVTAGPTVEDVDPVRYLTNRSSGKMGVALARQAALRGAIVELVHGPMKAPIPRTPGLRAHAVRSAQSMHDAVHEQLKNDVDVAIMSAAVADARPKTFAKTKIKKTEGGLKEIALVETPDILASLGKLPVNKRPLLVGFAAETTDVAKYARDKLTRKKCDLICANDVSEAGSGFDVDTNRLLLVSDEGDEWLPPLSKDVAADNVLDWVKYLLFRRAQAADKPRHRRGQRGAR